MRACVTPFWVQKAGNTSNEYEDALWPQRSGERQGSLLRFAVADGTTEGTFTGKWARLLVRRFCKCKADQLDPKGFIQGSARAWDSWKRRYVEGRERSDRPIQWFEAHWLHAGASSTFLGLTLRGSDEHPSGIWEAIAIGDSCLFQVRADELVSKFPIEYSGDFHNRPLLVSSNGIKNIEATTAFRSIKGSWEIDDKFFLMTDALASWFLHESEEKRAPWRILHALETDAEQLPFKEWVTNLRETRKLRNDDVSLLRIALVYAQV